MKTKIIIVALILSFLLLYKCNYDRVQKLKGERNQLEKQFKEQKKVVLEISLERKKEKDSLNKEITKREEINKSLQSQNNRLKKDIQIINSTPIKPPKDLEGLSKYFNERYKTKENLVVENKVGLGLETAYDVSYELEEFDNTLKIKEKQDTIITNQEVIIDNLSKDKDALVVQVSSAEKEIKERERLQKLGEENLETIKKENRKIKTKSVFQSVIIGTISFLIGKAL